MSFYLFRKMIRKAPGNVIRAVPLPDPVITEGLGARARIGEICMNRGYLSVLIVTDRNISSLGFQDRITAELEKRGISYTLFDGISGEPTAEYIQNGRRAAKKCRADCIVALGGGSVLDSCKIISAGSSDNIKNIGHYLTKFVFVKKKKCLPVINVPTTAGTGAEMTVGAVVKNSFGMKNSSVVVGLNITDVILDSELTLHAPEKVTVSCGIDALSHGLEGCLADIQSEEEDIRKSRECVKLVMENLPVLITDPENIDSRQKLCLAANYGGNAINKQLAGYVHAFAHSIGGLYHIPHGEAIARCILPVTEFHRDISRDRLAGLAEYCGLSDRACSEEEAADRFLSALRALLEKCGFTGAFVAVQEKDYNVLVRSIDADSINYSPPKTLTDKEIRILLDQIREGLV